MTCLCQVPPRGVRVRPSEGRTNEASQVYGRADYWRAARERCGGEDRRSGAQPRRFGSDAYNWKAKYGSMDVSEAKRLRQLEDENAKLKRLLAEQMLDAAALRELLAKKW